MIRRVHDYMQITNTLIFAKLWQQSHSTHSIRLLALVQAGGLWKVFLSKSEKKTTGTILYDLVKRKQNVKFLLCACDLRKFDNVYICKGFKKRANISPHAQYLF